MDKSNIAIFAAVMAVAAIKIYQNYKKKNKSGSNTNTPSGTYMPPSQKDDDYEPYSKK